jgi:hypothetical protein
VTTLLLAPALLLLAVLGAAAWTYATETVSSVAGRVAFYAASLGLFVLLFGTGWLLNGDKTRDGQLLAALLWTTPAVVVYLLLNVGRLVIVGRRRNR